MSGCMGQKICKKRRYSAHKSYFFLVVGCGWHIKNIVCDTLKLKISSLKTRVLSSLIKVLSLEFCRCPTWTMTSDAPPSRLSDSFCSGKNLMLFSRRFASYNRNVITSTSYIAIFTTWKNLFARNIRARSINSGANFFVRDLLNDVYTN